MSHPRGTEGDRPNTYIVQNRSNGEEMTRLELQDTMLTTGMGGVLHELTDPTSLRRILDVGCGTGGWLRETARTYPQIETMVGVDISNKMVMHARALAEKNQLGERVQFQVMDALQRLAFSVGYFDLLNQRLGASWVRRWEWTKLLVEYYRVIRPGGILRITEGDILIESTSSALTKLNRIVLEAVSHSGRLFAPSSDGLTRELARLLTQHAFENVQTHRHTLVYRAGEVSGQWFYEDMARFYRVGLPFLEKWTAVPGDYQETYQQALKEMRQPDFVATWTFLTVWGTKRLSGEPLLVRGLL